MTLWQILTLSVIVLVILGLGTYWIMVARRLDRLHRFVIASRTTLSDTLAHRARISHRVAQEGLLDLAGSVLLHEASARATELSYAPLVEDGLEGTPRQVDNSSDRRQVESALSRTLREVLREIDREDLTPEESVSLEQLQHSREAVRIARRMHNLRVDQVRRVREKRIVRWLRMAGTASMPIPVDLDDE